MDDALKLQKLAAARSKLKTHQQKKQKKPESTTSDTRSVDSVSSSNGGEQPTVATNASPVPQIQSYFTAPATISSTAHYFDNVPVEANDLVVNTQNMPVSNTGSNLVSNNASADAVSFEDPEINPNLVYEFAQQKQQQSDAQMEGLSMSEQVRQLNDQLAHTLDAHSNGYEGYSNYSDLEKRNLELASGYEKEKLQVEQLTASLEEYKAHVAQLERQIELLRVESETNARNALAPLENEIATHRQTLGILVGEKTELSASLNHTQSLLKHKTTECEELQARLKTSRSRVADFERELTCLKEERGRHAQLQSGHHQEFERMQQELHELRASKTEAEHDLSEMRERLRKVQESNALLSQACHECEGKLELANVKIQQLTAGSDSSESERFMQERQALERQILDLNTSLKSALSEREQSGAQYQQYVQQLNANITSLAEQLDASTAANDKLITRENELVQHISELEKRLQNQQQESINLYKQPPGGITSSSDSDDAIKDPNIEVLLNQSKDYEARVADIQAKLDAVRAERDEFIKDVEAKKGAIEALEASVERLKGNQSDSVQLLADIESEKVAASRAVAQNGALKQQLAEMQAAFVRMTNDKADLATQLSSERFRAGELEEAHAHVAHQLRTLTEAIEIKDRELTLMREQAEAAHKHVDEHACAQDQLNDRLRHYEAAENSAHALTHELQHARETIQSLTSKNRLLETQLAQQTAAITTSQHVQTEFNDLHTEVNDRQTSNDTQNFNDKEKVNDPVEVNEPHDTNLQTVNDPLDVNAPKVNDLPTVNDQQKMNVPLTVNDDTAVRKVNDPVAVNDAFCTSPPGVFSREIAMRQLEAKFMRTMQDIANLQDEKQSLEHLVLQLQGETETIGEYIALYQHQRGVLKQRAIEKETQLKQLAADREHMKRQLHMLNALITRLLAENRITDGVLEEQRAIIANTSAMCEVHAKEHQIMKDSDVSGNGAHASTTQATAQQIMALLGEIKTSNLVQPPTDVTDTFHPCPLCSGQLITV